MSSFYNVDAWQKANHNTPYEWDYSLGPSRTMVTQYDQVSYVRLEFRPC